ncbi:MAG: MCE family protein [Saprospiraceae bacterium]|nr:MCE family protein [Saprospiraceae bacterium]
MFKLSNETKIGILAIAAIALAIFGFKYLKGINVLKTSRTFKVRYENVDQLRPSAPVFISGLQVGTVKQLYIDPKDGKTIIAELNIEGSVDIPKDAVATIVGLTLMGGKAIRLDHTRPCNGDCARSGDFLLGASESFLGTVVGDPSQLDPYFKRLQTGLGSVVDSLADPNDPKGIGRSILALNRSLENIAILTGKLNVFLDRTTAGFAATANNTAEITGALRASNQDLSATIANLAAISAQLKNANLDQGAQKAAMALDTLVYTMNDLRNTLGTTEHALARVDTLAQGLSQGKGTAGKLLTDDALYYNLVDATRHLELLTQDLRLNPKRYTTVKLKVFGKNKTGPYQNPLDDPAYQLVQDSLERDYYLRLKDRYEGKQ